MQKIDFRKDYQDISIISFSITFFLYILVRDYLSISQLPTPILNFILGLGFYVFVFRLILSSYNIWLWKYTRYRDINIEGCWKYVLESEKGSPRIGYAIISQDLYHLSLYGFAAGSGDTKKGIAIWHASDAYISGRTLHYDYELFGERPERSSHILRGRTSAELIIPPKKLFFKQPPIQMTGNFYNIPFATDKNERVVGSIFFERVSSDELPSAIKAQFSGSNSELDMITELN